MMVCPHEMESDLDCEISSIFLPAEYTIPIYIRVLLKVVGMDQETVTCIPFQLHSLSLSLFASIIAPFGGFFASGFKRAFKIKVSKSK